ncbi:MAG: arginine decarboxylase, pyruvoyl-dependent [Candidatus Methanofastidiosa archaeon]|nr:arginine decarboxylase, pyruvoyl-dependent [Candidatus Methanofastidiosa archaeon]
MITPHSYVLISCKGAADSRLNAFDAALHSAGIADFNFITVSSILPKGCKKTTMDAIKGIERGSFMYCVMSKASSNMKGETISSAIACARTKETVGVVTESSGSFSSRESEERAREMCKEMLSIRNATPSSIDTTSAEMLVEQGWGCCISLCLLLY